jgi:hypothetical protein
MHCSVIMRKNSAANKLTRTFASIASTICNASRIISIKPMLRARCIEEAKKFINAIMDCTGTPATYWLLCLLFVVYMFNHLSTESIGREVPLTVAYGGPTDCSALLNCSWFEDALYTAEGSYPSEGKGILGKWVGVTEKQDDALTYLILTVNTDRVIARSVICSATNTMNPNLRAPQSSTREELDNNPKPILQSTEDLLGIY